jgi:hypothetical protein
MLAAEPLFGFLLLLANYSNFDVSDKRISASSMSSVLLNNPKKI